MLCDAWIAVLVLAVNKSETGRGATVDGSYTVTREEFQHNFIGKLTFLEQKENLYTNSKKIPQHNRQLKHQT